MVDPNIVPFNRPAMVGSELDYIRQATAAMHLSGDGVFSKRCQGLLERELGVPRALLTTSCTHALEIAALLLRLQPGDEVIVPAYSFVTTANAFVLHGARAVFVDVRPDTLNLDERLLERAMGPRTRAVVPVHYAGVACAMDEILDVCQGRGVPVVEDNAHGLFGRYHGKPLGSLGSLGALSFHETKNFTCGEGGALIINDDKFMERAEILREKGTNRRRFFRGEVDKYTWVDVGSSFLPSDILAAFLFAQLEARERVQALRQRAWRFYARELDEWAANEGVQLPTVPEHCDQSFHMFYVIFPSLQRRQEAMSRLHERGVNAVFHYQPLHLSEMGRQAGGREGDCPVAEQMADRLLRLPFFHEISEEQQRRVVDALCAST